MDLIHWGPRLFVLVVVLLTSVIPVVVTTLRSPPCGPDCHLGFCLSQMANPEASRGTIRAVDCLRQRANTDATPFQAVDGLDELRERPRQAVEFPDDDGVVWPGEFESGLKLHSIQPRAGRRFLKQALATGREKSVPLHRGVLLRC